LQLEVFEVDDSVDPWKDPSTQSVDDGIRIKAEPSSVGETHFAEVALRPGESMDEAKARLLAFVRGVSLPADHFFGFQKNFGSDLASEDEAPGWRTFVLRGEAVLTDAHLRAAELRRYDGGPDGSELHLDFNDEGRRLLAELSERCLRLRIALVIDGVVQSAPVVMSRIDGGRAQVWLADRPDSEIPDRFASGVLIERR